MGEALIDRVEHQPQSGELAASNSIDSIVTLDVLASNPDAANLDRFLNLRQQVYVALFAAFNLLCAKIILALPYFQAMQPAVPYVWATLVIALSTLTLAVCYPPLLAVALRHVRDGRCSVEVIKAFTLTLATIATLYGLFLDFGSLGHQYLYQALPWLVAALTLEQYLFLLFEGKADENSEFNLLRLAGKVRRLEPYPNHAPVEALVAADRIRPGELFKLGAGEFVPCDGKIIEGTAELRERRYSGRPSVRIKSKGHRVFAGSEVVQGEVLCESVALCDDSVITSFVHALEKRVQLTSDTFEAARAIESRLGLLLLVAAVCIGTYAIGAGASVGAVAGLLACVLSLGLILRAPTMWAYLPGLIHTTAFRRGILFRDEASISKLASVRDMLVDVRLLSPPGRITVQSVEILDDRVDRDSLFSVILGVLGNSDDETYSAVTEYLRTQVHTPALHKVSDLRMYEHRGVCASVAGAEFTLGSEAFLIERGVQIQGWELGKAEDYEQLWYVAMLDEIVARITIALPFTADAAHTRQRLDALGIRAIVCSADDAEGVDKLGKRAKFELSSIFGGLNAEQYTEKLRTHSPAAFLINDTTAPLLAESSSVTVSFFDDVRWNLERSDVLLLNTDLDELADMFLIARLARSVRIMGLVVLALIFGLCIAIAGHGLLAAALLSSVIITGLLLVSLNHFRLLLP